VFWGIVYSGEEPPDKSQVIEVLREAGFDCDHNEVTRVELTWDAK
jgi:hypothetical protein